VDSFLC